MEKLIEFPTSGWCKDFNEDILKYLNSLAKTDVLRVCREKGKCGFAWQKYGGNRYHEDFMNVWAVKGESSKTQYSVTQLLRVIPDEYKTKSKSSIVSWLSKIPPEPTWDIGAHSGTGKSYISKLSGSIGVYESDNSINIISGIDDYHRRNEDLRILAQKEAAEIDRRKRELFMPIWMDDDRITSMGMSLMSGIGKTGSLKDKFTQQETILVKRKKKKRNLIFS